MRKYFIPFLIFTLLSLTGCGITLDITSDDVAYTIEVGDIFTITLEENPSTGYIWQGPTISDESIVELIGGPETIGGSSNVVGAPNMIRWTFKAKARGIAVITFKSIRPWENNPIDKKNFTILVKQID